jgi:hypothetical protein
MRGENLISLITSWLVEAYFQIVLISLRRWHMGLAWLWRSDILVFIDVENKMTKIKWDKIMYLRHNWYSAPSMHKRIFRGNAQRFSRGPAHQPSSGLSVKVRTPFRIHQRPCTLALYMRVITAGTFNVVLPALPQSETLDYAWMKRRVEGK